MKQIAEYDLDGYAIGGLAVGEPAEVMYDVISAVEPYAPADKIRYLMGVGTPGNIIEGVYRGVDLFDCVMPSRNARHGHLFTWNGIINIKNLKYERDEQPIDRSAIARSAAITAALTSATCKRQMKCWVCVWLLCTTCISTII